MNAIDQYAELLRLTRAYLLQEHTLSDRLLADSETYTYFRNFIAQKMPPKSHPPVNQSVNLQTTAPAPVISAVAVPAKVSPIASIVSAVDEKPITPIQSVPSAAVIEAQVPAIPSTDLKLNLKPVIKVEPEIKGGSIFIPEPPSSAAEVVEVGEIRKILEKSTSLRFCDIIPSDIEAKKRARIWEQEQVVQVIIITFNDNPKDNHFLENLRFAIEVQGLNAKLIKGKDAEKNKKWDALLTSKSLRLVIATNWDIEASADLKRQYREIAQPAKYTLGNIPLFLLADPTTYMADPHLKQTLWKSLKEKLVSS